MGVHGLWQLLNSTGKPVPLDSLEGKVLAVDVSVWLHQLSKGMRDSSGNPLPNAHLHGLFTRICKLLYYRIKPVFVFDGGVPILKKQTLASRRNKREDAERTSSQMQQKILTNLIRSQALKEACGLDKLPDLPPPPKSSAKGNKEALYQLPPLPESSRSYLSQKNAGDETEIDRWELQQMVEDEYEGINKIDVESEDFKALPAEVQHEVITDMRLNKKNYNLARIVDLPDDSKDFSNYQMAKLVKYNKLNSRLDEIRKELNERQTLSLAKNFGKRFENVDDIYSQRVISDDSSHYILAKRNLQKRREEEEKELEKPKVENVLDKLEVINETDELLLDSDEDSCEEVDIMEESRLIFEEISGKSDEIGEIEEQRYETTKNKQISKENEKSFKPRQREKSVVNKPRFRAVIEVESDSESESSDQSVEQIESTENEIIVVDDGTVDTELQFAIEQSLKEQRNNTKSEDLNNVTGNISRKKSNDLELCNKLNEKSERQGGQAITATKKESQSTDKKGQRAFGKKSSCKKSESVGNQLRKDTEKAKDNGSEISNCVKRVDRTDEVNATVRAETDTPVVMKESKTTSGIFKRKISCLSNGSADSEEGLSKIQRLDSSDTDSVVALAVEESSESEGEFIEVNIDLTKVKEDEMFPASMFETAVTSANDQEHVESDKEVDLVKSVSANTDNTMDVAKQIIQELSWNEPDKSELEVEKRRPQIRDADTEDIKDDAKIEESINVVENEDDLENEVEEKGNEDVEELAKDDTAEVEEDHISIVTEADVTSPDSTERKEYLERSRKRPSSPAVTSLVRQFESINEQHVKGLRENIASENRQLRLEQGKQERLAVSITDQMHAEAQELLQLFGIPYIVSPTEAEAQCAQLELIKLTNGTITDDSDIWLFGGKCVFKNFFNQQKHVECFRDVNINAQLGLNRESLINIALLCGSDYTEGIRGVGPVTAMEILAKFPGSGIEGLAKFKTWWEDAQREIKVPLKQSKFLAKLRNLDIHEGFPNTQVVEAYLSPTVDDSKEKFSWSLPDLQELRLFASSKLKWTREKTDEVLLPVLKRLAENRTQRSISAFFQPEIYMNPAPVKSKRLQKVVNKFVYPEEAEDDSENEQNEVKKKKRSKGQKGQDDTECEVNETSKKKGSKCQKSQDGNKKQTDSSEMQETDKRTKSRKTRSNKKIQSETESVHKSEQKSKNSAKSKDLGQERRKGDGEEVMYTNKTENITKAREGNTTRGRGSGRGRGGRGRGSSTKPRSKVIETQTSSSDSYSSMDSESDSLRSDSDYEDEILADKESGDEEPVIESSLNIAEILSLKMGCNMNELKPGKESKQKGKVYENVINVNEILHLESGGCNAVNEIKEESCISDDVNDTVVKSKDNLSEKLNVKKEIKIEELVNEGRFISEDGMEKKVLSATIDKNNKADDSAYIETSAYCTMIVKDSDVKSDTEQLSVAKNAHPEKETSVESSVIKTCKHGSKRTRSSKTNSRRDESVEPKTGLKDTESIETKETDEVKKNACLDTGVRSNPGEIKENSKTNVVKAVALATVKPIQSKGNKDKLKDVKQESDVYSNDPIKQLVSGLPWAEKGKGRKRGGGGKGHGRAKVQKLTPIETFVKKLKPKESKRTFGSVNLSESDSDESE